jgi:hypothetical protein
VGIQSTGKSGDGNNGVSGIKSGEVVEEVGEEEYREEEWITM